MNKFWIAAAAAGLLALPGMASAADLSGAWKLVVNVADMTVHVSCDLKQSGADLAGTCNRTDADGAEKPTAITGKVDGSTATWSYSISMGDMPLKLDYTGTVASDTAMSGKISVAGMDGKFTGTKG
jgi:hypothetical protein